MFWWLAHSQRGRAASEYRSMDDLLQIAPVGATATKPKKERKGVEDSS